jgi:hypothetical protein
MESVRFVDVDDVEHELVIVAWRHGIEFDPMVVAAAGRNPAMSTRGPGQRGRASPGERRSERQACGQYSASHPRPEIGSRWVPGRRRPKQQRHRI